MDNQQCAIKQYDIILVDDNEIVAKMAERALKKNLNFSGEMKWFDDAERAHAFFFPESGEGYAERKELHPALILLDLNMPLMSGHEFLEIIKSNAATSHIPVVMFSSSEDPKDIDKSYSLGANGYVIKSTDTAAFMETVRDTGFYWINQNRPVHREPPTKLKTEPQKHV